MSDLSISSGCRFNLLAVGERLLPLPRLPTSQTSKEKETSSLDVRFAGETIPTAVSHRALNSGIGIIFGQIIAPWDEFQ